MTQQDLISEAWNLTEAIESAAASNDWARAAELTETRSPLLMALGGEQSADALATIRKIQASMDAVRQQAEAAQHALVSRHRQSMDQANAASQYQQAAQIQSVLDANSRQPR